MQRGKRRRWRRWEGGLAEEASELERCGAWPEPPSSSAEGASFAFRRHGLKISPPAFREKRPPVPAPVPVSRPNLVEQLGLDCSTPLFREQSRINTYVLCGSHL